MKEPKRVSCHFRLYAPQIQYLKREALEKSLETNEQITWADLAREAITAKWPEIASLKDEQSEKQLRLNRRSKWA
jgi:hypothetical protein